MSCCAHNEMKECVSDIREDKRNPEVWTNIGCFESPMAAEAAEVAKNVAVSLAIFTVILAFSITLAFILCTPLMAMRKRRMKTYKVEVDLDMDTAETTPGGGLPPPIPSKPKRLTRTKPIEDPVTRWHSQFGSRFYDKQIFNSYQQGREDHRHSRRNHRNDIPLPPRR